MAEKLFVYKQRKDEKEGGDSYISYEIEVKARERTYKQINTVWALIKIMFVSMNGYNPTKEESYDLYLDVLDLYANKTPNRFTGGLRPVHLSESDVEDAMQLINHILGVMVDYCDLPIEAQSEVKKLFIAWQGWRGELVKDALDYDRDGNILSVREWRETHKVSDASGIGGYLEAAHIVSRGASPSSIDDVRDLIMLTLEEHQFQHQHGWSTFLERFPHLKGRVLRARQLFGATPLDKG